MTDAPGQRALSDHLFRREAGRMVAALTRIFGVHNLALAEDVVQDAFCRALDVWKTRGVPLDPAAWLLATAKNRAVDLLRRERTGRTLAPEMALRLELDAHVADAFADHVIRDEQLRMMFSCCEPRLPEAAQVALILNILCGLGVHEIANAFLTSRAAMEKRIARAKRALAGAGRLFDLAATEFPSRLSAVRRALYLLFNEGYQGASPDAAVRADLTQDAIRLAALLHDYPPAADPETLALSSLMCLHAARLPARLDAAGDLTPFADQDRSRWDARLTAEGLALLERAAVGPTASAYHVEAAIAAAHAAAPHPAATDWGTIIGLYDRLMDIAPSPVVALNRAVAIAQRDGPERGLAALDAIAGRDRLARYPFYPAARGELELRRGEGRAAAAQFGAALALARNGAERRFLERRIAACAAASPTFREA